MINCSEKFSKQTQNTKIIIVKLSGKIFNCSGIKFLLNLIIEGFHPTITISKF